MDSVKSGNPNNWPRRIARKHRRLPDAVEELRGSMDDANMQFAIVEFCHERIRMAKRVKHYPPKHPPCGGDER